MICTLDYQISAEFSFKETFAYVFYLFQNGNYVAASSIWQKVFRRKGKTGREEKKKRKEGFGERRKEKREEGRGDGRTNHPDRSCM